LTQLQSSERTDRSVAYRERGWWRDETLADDIARHAAVIPDAPAFITEHHRVSWRQYAADSDRLAGVLVAAGYQRGERVGVQLPDTAAVHIAFVGLEKAGLVAVGIGARAGDRELRHLLARTRASGLITHAGHRGRTVADGLGQLREHSPALRHHIVLPEAGDGVNGAVTVDGDLVAPAPARQWRERKLGADELWLLNSTSGTTGLPKCVMHHQNRWHYFHRTAVEVAGLCGADIFMAAVPAPFGFGQWTSHFTPTLLGAPAVVMERFDASRALALIERERVSVLCAVSTQFILMLNAPDLGRYDLTSLRVLFTGGELIPYERARDFERRTGATVLNFYGSNESGFATATTLTDPAQRRLRTAGRVQPGTELRLYAGGRDVTSSGRGQPGSRGPASSLGYLDDPAGNAELFTPDGFVLHADEVTLDAEGYLKVVRRKSDIIIRGGKNISAPAVEDEVGAHPAVALVAAVPSPDPVFGERVCVYVELAPGASLELDELLAFLRDRGVSPEYLPERLVRLKELPRSSGGKLAKGQLRDDAAARFGASR
jgi:acyl-CoA synthetase